MDLKENFFKLNYLCLNNFGPISNESVIIEQSIKKQDKNQRNKSNKNSISKLPSTPKYNKINHSKKLLKEKNSSKDKIAWSRAKLNSRKVLNNICQSYYNDNSKNMTEFGSKFSLSPTTSAFRDNKHKKNFRFNIYNQIVSKTNNNCNNKHFNRISTGTANSNENISLGNIINNTFMPMTETKYNYLNNNNTYYHTNFVFKFDSNPNFNKKKLCRGSSQRLTPDKKASKNIKNYFEANNNSIYNNYFSQNENLSSYASQNNIDRRNSNKINYMDEEQEKNTNKNGVKNYKISYKLCNDTVLLENQDIKKEMSKILKNKDNLKSVINSLKKGNYTQKKIKIKQFNKNKNIMINSKSYLASGKSNYKKNSMDFNKKTEINSKDGDNFDEGNTTSFKFLENNIKNDEKDQDKKENNLQNKEDKENIFYRSTSNGIDLKIEEYKNSNNELKNNNKKLKTEITKYESNINTYRKDISKLKDKILKLTNENDTLKLVLKNSINLKLPGKPSFNNSPSPNEPKTKSYNKYMRITQIKKDYEEKNNKLNESLEKLKKENESYEKEITEKNKIIDEKENLIQNLKKSVEDYKIKVDSMEKDMEEIKKENDRLYQYKSLYEDKEIELIQFKNNINKSMNENNRYDSLKIEYDELMDNYNKIKDFKDKYYSLMKDYEKLKGIKKSYNDLNLKYNNIKEKSVDIDKFREIENKYNELSEQNINLNSIKNKYEKMKVEFEELKEIREKYGKILKEQKNLLLIENKYNDLIEEVKELRDIKYEYEKMMECKDSENKDTNDNNEFKIQNISFGENGNI